MTFLSQNRWEIGLVIILCVSAYLRLWRISEYLTFLGDEGRDALIVRRMIVEGKFTLLGPTASVGGFFMGPIYYYFMLPFLWAFNLDPTGPAVMVALFGIVTVYLVYKIGREMTHPYVGFVASTLYALSPIVISYSRSSWNPNVVPFFSLLLIYYLWKLAGKASNSGFFFVGLILGIGIQLHYVFLFLCAVTAIWLVIKRNPIRYFMHYCMSFFGLVTGLSLFLLFELRHGLPNTRSIIKFLSTGNETGFDLSTFLRNIADVLFRLFGRLVYRIPEYATWNSFPSLQQQFWVILTNSTIIASIILFVFIFIRKKIPKQIQSFLPSGKTINPEMTSAFQILFLWVTCTVLFFGLYKRAIYEYYFGIFFAFPFIMVGILLWILWSRHKIGKIVSVTMFCILIAVNWGGRPFINAPNNQLFQVRKIAEAVLDKTDGKPFNFALISGGNSDHAYRFFFEVQGRKPVTIEIPEVDPERKTITDQLIVLCEDPGCHPLGHPLWEIAGFGKAEIASIWDAPFTKIYKLVHVSESAKLP